MIDLHTLETLEFPAIIEAIKGKCVTPYGSEAVAVIEPLYDKETIDQRLDEVLQMKDLINFGSAFPLYRVRDSRNLLHRSRTEGAFLDPSDILIILELVEVSIALHDYDREERPKFPAVAAYLPRLRAFPELRKEIRKCIDEHGEVKESASPRLKRICMELGESRRRIVTKLENLLSKTRKQAGWQDDVITIRSGRYVIPVIAGSFSHDMGILHDRSQSGATLYVEPKDAVELNNRINDLMQQKRVELDRILRYLTGEIAARADALEENCRLIGILDRVHAAAAFANEIGATRPNVRARPDFTLRGARHPLLIRQLGDAKKVVPFDLKLEDDRRALLITGPNTGGKTVALKATGLIILMVQSGLLVPVVESSDIGIFEHIFADIGDEQSIELSLSTFSSHIQNIIKAVENVNEHSLVLFDEIGAGTDPKEGAALAEAIILYLLATGCKLVATTHYSHLKTLPLEHPAIENASLEFDRQSLQPTYRLQLGIPGSSYAVEIAGRLGLPEEICKQATILLGSSERSLTELIASLEEELATIRKDKKQLSDQLEKARALEARYRLKLDELKNAVNERAQAAAEETERLLEQTRKETERLVAEIRQTQASKKSVRLFHQTVRGAMREVTRIKRRTRSRRRPPVSQISYAVGDFVRILSLNQEGEIEELLGNSKARVRVGNVTTTVQFRNLEKLTGLSVGASRTPLARLDAEQVMSPEIHLRGMTVDEATAALDKFLDQAVVSGLTQVYVIHGKGTGTLRRTLNEHLKNHPEVSELRLGNWNEGGAGVTVAKLKS